MERHAPFHDSQDPALLLRQDLVQIESVAAPTDRNYAWHEGSNLVVDDVVAFRPQQRLGAPAKENDLQPMRMLRRPDRSLEDAGIPLARDSNAHQMHFVAVGDQAIHEVRRAALASSLAMEVEGDHGYPKPALRHRT
jgi:hypothetical protein